MSSVVIVGGGIAGLVTALRLEEAGVDVTVLEASSTLGGMVKTSEIAGVAVDEGPDAFLVREPYMHDLCVELGIGTALVSPRPGAARIWLRGTLRPLPKKQYLGVPLDLDELAETGLISPEGIARAQADLQSPADFPEGDESAGAMIRRRLGDEVLENLVGPLLGGINAGDADTLSLRAGVPQLYAAASHDASLVRSVPRYLASQPRDPNAPIFESHPGGLATVIEALADRLGDRIETGQPVQTIGPDAAGGWIVEARRDIAADAVVLATPAFASSYLLTATAPVAAKLLGSIDYASVAVATLAFAADDLPPWEGSGFLVPRAHGLLMTACTWASSKWAHLDHPGTTFLRIHAGHWGDERAMAMDDETFVRSLRDELLGITGIAATPIATRVSRWPRSFPQYRPGHLDTVERIEQSLAAEAPGVFVTGAAYRGLGLPACVNQANVAASRVLAAL